MSLSFQCPNCGKQYSNIKRGLIGKMARCACGKTIRLAEQLQDEQSNQVNTESESTKKADSTASIDHHYSDLDSILAGSSYEADTESDDRRFQATPIQATPIRATPIRATPIQPDKNQSRQSNQPRQRTAARKPQTITHSAEFAPAEFAPLEPPAPSTTKTTLSFLAVVASVSLAFWFGLLIVVSRFTTVDQILLHPFSEAIGNINSGRFGLKEIAPGLKIGFVICGWMIWSVAATMVLFAPLQLFNSVAQLFVHRQIFRFVDGLMATCGVLLVFLLVATLFLHTSHMANLKHELNQFDTPQAIATGESERQNVQRNRDQYESDSRNLMTVMLTGGIVPLSIFGFSMLRMLTSQFHVPRPSNASLRRQNE